MATPIAEFVVSLGTDGRIVSQGSLSKALAKDKKLSEEVAEENQEIKKAENEVDHEEPNVEAKKSDGKLIVAEEVSVGHVSWAACETNVLISAIPHMLIVIIVRMFFSSLGGGHPFLFWMLCVGTLALSELADTIQTWFLGFWARQYEDHDPSEVKVPL